MNETTELLFLLASLVGGMSLGSLLHGLWRSRAAERAQTGAWGTSSGLSRKVAKPPRHYRHRGSVIFAIELSLALAIVMMAWFPLGTLPSLDTVAMLSLAFWFSMGALAALFPLFLGLPLAVLWFGLWTLFSLAQGTLDPARGFGLFPARPISDMTRSVHVETPLLYRLASPRSWVVDAPTAGSWQEASLGLLKVLPGLDLRSKKQ